MMFAKVWLINIVLGAIVFSVTLQAVDVWTQTDTPFPGAIVSDQEKPPVQRRVIPPETEPETAYDLIPEKTLFSEDRAEFVSETGEAEPGKTRVSASRKPVFLYGVVMVGDYRKALVRENAGGSGDDRWVFEGDKIAGMTITSIEKEKILLSSDTGIVEVSLYDRGKPKKTGPQFAKTEKPKIVTLSSGDALTSSQKTDAEKPTEQGKPEKEGSDSKSNFKDTDTVPKGKPDTQEATSSNSGKISQQPSPFQIGPEQKIQTSQGTGEYEIIRTPFGEIQRKKIKK